MKLSQAQYLANKLSQLCKTQMEYGYFKPRVVSSDEVVCADEMGDYVLLVSSGLNSENREQVDAFIQREKLESCYDFLDGRKWRVLFRITQGCERYVGA